MHHVILEENLQTTLNLTPLKGIHLAKGRIHHFYSLKLLFNLQQVYTQTLPEAKWGSDHSCWKLAIGFILTPCIRLSMFIRTCILFGERYLEFCSINSGPQTMSLENYVLVCCIKMVILNEHMNILQRIGYMQTVSPKWKNARILASVPKQDLLSCFPYWWERS